MADDAVDEGAAQGDDDLVSEETRVRFIQDMKARGEVVSKGGDLPPGATHELDEDAVAEGGKATLNRRRFSAY